MTHVASWHVNGKHCGKLDAFLVRLPEHPLKAWWDFNQKVFAANGELCQVQLAVLALEESGVSL